MRRRNILHGKSKSHTYGVWRAMWNRCTNKERDSYHNYGGRGIKVDGKWFQFTDFLRDMGECPEGYQIDRIDVDGDYTRNNCRWTTKGNNRLNKRGVDFRRILDTLTTEELHRYLDYLQEDL